MKISALVFLILISEKTFCFQLESERDEAVFQGKCSENLCMQLCYELHDGMFECDCTQGYELNLDGYSCKPNNISYNPSSKLGRMEDYSSSDVFYQKGVSFSAKLEDISSRKTDNDIKQTDNHGRNSTIDIKKGLNVLRNSSSYQSYPLPDVSVNIPRFYQTSWLAFRPFKGANLVTEINIEFRPEQSNGILLMSGEREDLNGDFMIVSLSNGLIEFLFDCGSGKGVIISNEKVILHQWNSLIIYRYRWDAWIELNDQRRVRGRSSGIFSRITFRSPVFLGGKGNLTSETLHKKKIRTSRGFSGCIRKFVVNGHQFELSQLSSNEIISTSNLNECAIDQCSFVKCVHGGRCQSGSSSCLCPLGFGGKFCEKKLDLKIPFFNGTSNLRYSALGETAIIWLELRLEIKPHSSDGLILFSGQYDLGDFIALYLNFGFVEFIYDLGSGVTSVKSKFPLSLGQWHTIKISRTARLAVMKVDTQQEVMAVSPNGFWHLSLPYSLYLGGVSKFNLLPSNLRDRGLFMGCIKQFEINGRKIELIDDALGGINIGNCNDTCLEHCRSDIMHDNNFSTESTSRTNKFSDIIDIDNEISDDHISPIIHTNKYSFDVVDDQLDDPLHITEKEENGNFSYDDTVHKRIVRVSLQKTTSRNQGTCFKGNDSYVLHDMQKFINADEKYQNNVNIRFKTSSSNGLILLIFQKAINAENIFSLTVEDGFMHLRYNHRKENFDIRYGITKVNDGLWHRVRAMRKNQKGSLRIDGGRAVSIRRRSKQKLFNSSLSALYLGGTTSSLLPGFIGCISDVIFNSDHTEHHLDLNSFRAEESQNVNSGETL